VRTSSTGIEQSSRRPKGLSCPGKNEPMCWLDREEI